MILRGIFTLVLAAMLFGPATASAQRTVDAGYWHSCAIKPDSTPVCWGDDRFKESTIPAGLGTVTAISVGLTHTCAIKTAGTAACWGVQVEGVGSVPADLGTVTAISSGEFHNCAIKTGGTLACWGRNNSGQITIPAGLGTVKAVSAGGNGTCVIKTDDSVACWGNNGALLRVPPAGLKATAISTGASNACAIDLHSNPVCWGGFSGRTLPAGLGTVKSISSGDANNGCAVKTDGTPVCWGNNDAGQATIPPSVGTATSISAGHSHACAVRTDGYVTCWGVFVRSDINQPVTPAQPGEPGPVPPNATRNAPYSHLLTANPAPPRTYSVVAGALPSGLTLNPGGLLSGTPIAFGDFTFTVRAVDDVFAPVTKQFTITVGAPPAVTTNPASKTVIEGADATFTVAGTGTPAPTVQWSRKAPGETVFTEISGATTATLTLPDVTRAQDGTEVRAILTNAIGQATSSTATLTVNVPPAIAGQPADQIATEGADAIFTVAAEGHPAPTVQWQRRAPGDADFTNIAGATSPSLTLAAVTPAQDGTEVRAVVVNRSGTVISGIARLTVDRRPVVTEQPVDAAALPGADAIFTVAVAGSPAPTVQWQRKAPGEADFSDVAGAVAPTLTLAAVGRAQDGTQVRAVVTNRAGTVTSAVATLRVTSVAPVPPVVDPVPPLPQLTLGLTGRRTQKVGKKRRFRLALRCSAACTAKLTVKVKPKRGKARKLKAIVFSLPAGTSKIVTVKLPKGLIGTATATAAAPGATAKPLKIKLRRSP